MKTRRLLHGAAGAALGLALLLPASAPAQVRKAEQIKYPPLPAFNVPKPTRVMLDNGMVVILIEDHELPLIEASALIRTGWRQETADKVGLSGLVGNVLRTGGTAKMTGDQLDDWLEGRAAVIETSISETSGNATVSCLKKDFPEVLGVFADILRNPAFDEEKLKIAKNQANSLVARQNDNPQQILFREFNEIVYGGDSPFARTPTYASLGAVTRDDLIAWHKRDFLPNNMILGLVGDFNTGEATEVVKRVFADWRKGSPTTKADDLIRKDSPVGVYYVEKNDMTQSNIAMGHLGILRNNPDYYTLEVMNEVMSGGFAARLFSNVRTKKGLAYTVRGTVGSDWDHPGLTQFWMTTKTETTGAGIEALLEEARNMTAQPPTEEEVNKAKQAILNSFVFNSDSRRKILQQQITYEYYGYPLDWLEKYRAGIDKVTTPQVREAAAKYIHPDQFALLVVGPKQGQDKPLSDFGKVTAVDITIPEPSAARLAATSEGLEKGKVLIAKAVEAMGGAAKIDSLRTLEQKGITVASTPQGQMEIKTALFVAWPDRLRQEMVLPFGTMTTVFSPQAAFMMTPQGARPLPDSRRADVEKGMRRAPLSLLKSRNQPDFRAVAHGSDQIEGRAVEVVQVELTGDAVTLAIDPADGRILRMSYHGTGPTGAPGDMVQTFSDFRTVEGISYPFASTTTFNGEPSMSTRTDSLTLDAPINEADFAPPESVTASKSAPAK